MTDRDPATMTDRQINAEGLRIVRLFEDYSSGDPYGWDWPTMFGVFPAEVARFRALRAEWRERHPKPVSASAS